MSASTSISVGVLVGFDQTEVTVIEGEQVSLSTSFKNGITIDTFLRSEQFFHVLTQQGRGNATGLSNYIYSGTPLFRTPLGQLKVS